MASISEISKYINYCKYLYKLKFDISENDRGILLYNNIKDKLLLISTLIITLFKRFEIIVNKCENLKSTISEINKMLGNKLDINEVYSKVSIMGNNTFDNKLLIIDDAHLFFKQIQESKSKHLYDTIMEAKSLRVIFLANSYMEDPFEIVPCFNILTGIEVLPMNYSEFYSKYVDVVSLKKSKLLKVFKNKVFNFKTLNYKIHVEYVKMSNSQYNKYIEVTSDKNLLERYSEKCQNIKAQMVSTFLPPSECVTTVSSIPRTAFTQDTSPKLFLIAQKVNKSLEHSLIYSKYNDIGGLKVMGRFLENLGLTPFHSENSNTENEEKEKIGGKDENPTFIMSSNGSIRDKLRSYGFIEKSLTESAVNIAWDRNFSNYSELKFGVNADFTKMIDTKSDLTEYKETDVNLCVKLAIKIGGGLFYALRNKAHDIIDKNILEALERLSDSMAINIKPSMTSNYSFDVFNCYFSIDKKGVYLNKVDICQDNSCEIWLLENIILPHFGVFGISKDIIKVIKLSTGALSPYINLFSPFDDNLNILPLNKATIDNVKKLTHIANNPKVFKHVGDGKPWSNKLFIIFNQSISDAINIKRDYYHWIIMYKNKAVGYVGLRPSPKDCWGLQFRYFIDTTYQRKGIATAACALALENYAAICYPKNPLIYSVISPSNKASIGVATKLGFTKSRPVFINRTQFNTFARHARNEMILPDLEDDFPYNRLHMPKFSDMVSKLLKLSNNFPSEWSKLQPDGRLGLVKRTHPQDYNSMDSLTDWEVEPVRINCRESYNISPIDAWHEVKDSIKNMNTGQQREHIYKISHGCNLFNIAFGVYLLKTYLKSDKVGDVLDLTSGWGDRLGCSFISGARSYRGWDTNIKLQPVYTALASRYKNMGLKLDWKISPTPFEKVPDSEVADKFDVVLTSPPFYDKEFYEGSDTSTSNYKSENDWYQNFYKIIWKKAAIAVRANGHIIAYVPSGRMKDEINTILINSGFKYLGSVGFVQTINGNYKPANIRDAFIWKKSRIGGNSSNKFAIVTGENLHEIQRIYNSDENINGSLIKVLLSSNMSLLTEFRWIKNIHWVEPSSSILNELKKLNSNNVQNYLYITMASGSKTIEESNYMKFKTITCFNDFLSESSLIHSVI